MLLLELGLPWFAAVRLNRRTGRRPPWLWCDGALRRSTEGRKHTPKSRAHIQPLSSAKYLNLYCDASH